jgi:hypothetical protein
MEDGTDENNARATRTDEWEVWEVPVGDRIARRGEGQFDLPFYFIFSLPFIQFVRGYSCPRDLRTAHRAGRRIPFVADHLLFPWPHIP